MKDKTTLIIEEKDVIDFKLKIKKIDDESDDYVFKSKKVERITLGKDEICPGLDSKIIGNDLTEEKSFEIEYSIDSQQNIFGENIEAGNYIFGFKIVQIQKHKSSTQNSNAIFDLSSLKDQHNDKKRIKELEEIINNLKTKLEKQEAEKQLAEQIFKAKAEEMAKNAATKVEVLKEEIKNKAKEDVDYKTKYAIQKLVDDLLSPLNNLYVAVEAGSKAQDQNVAAYVKGFQMLTSQIFNTLEMHGITVIEPKEGDIFNPEIHHAQEVLDDASYKKDQIIKLIVRGYKLNDRVLKPAIVVVAK